MKFNACLCLQGILKCISTKRLMNEIIGMFHGDSTNKELYNFLVVESHPAFILRNSQDREKISNSVYSRLKYAKIFTAPSLLYLFLYDQSPKYKAAISSLICFSGFFFR